jgi:nitrite reductase/ring-hydroxylating ferredoxin subunit
MLNNVSEDFYMATVSNLGERHGSSAKRGFYEPFNEYHMCWYPVMVASDLQPGSVKSMNFCDSRIAVYRGSDGAVRAVSARCKHMGADIGLGEVVGNHVRCPFHHWEYDGTGACVRIPSGDRIPNDTTLLSFPCEERQGLIWVFLGNEPTGPAPFIAESERERVLSRSFEINFEEPMRVEPWVLSTNVFDFAHFKSVHHFDMSNVSKFHDGDSQGWEGDIAGEGFLRLELRGIANVITTMQRPGETVPKRQLAGSCPKGGAGLTLFMTIFVELKDDSEEARQEAEKSLDEYEAFHRKIPAEDLTVINSIEFGKTRLTEVDRDLAEFLGYVQRYPRTTIRKLEAGL